MADSVILDVIENSFFKSGKLRHIPEVYHNFVSFDGQQTKGPYLLITEYVLSDLGIGQDCMGVQQAVLATSPRHSPENKIIPGRSS